ncbi:hypothetical protein L1887_16467 [Cichorium endivia]|nr:hypothetical protein L1887_16467 [Cichorium endivia]
MKFGTDLITGRERFLTSWKSPDDPSVGQYKLWLDTNGYPQIFVGKGLVRHARLGSWNGLGFRGLALENMNPILYAEFVVNQKEIYYGIKLKSSVILRRVLMSDGNMRQLNWIERTKEWVVYGSILVDSCSLYGGCGPYGICSIELPPCSCLEGFEPREPREWNGGDWSMGCQRKNPLNCGTRDVFHKISGVKFPDTRRSWYNVSMSLGECEIACRRNCSCTAYANLDIRNGGSGCLLWFDELMDIREYDDRQELYIRMATSEIAGQSSANQMKEVLTVMLLVSLATLVLSGVAYACRKKMKGPHKKGRGSRPHALNKEHTSIQMEKLDEIPFLSLHQIAKATDNFNLDNKIGEGGFGPVYKGVLEDGQVIAVKRLSETSKQGLDEFQNEVICIAKLQHRNLVKLLGYCIHGNEKILIYEYMDNKSLDSFLFDEARSSMLDWPQRFRIIHGIARGLLYLHQDSRLQIIHRDLKAGNILLDSEMNPKISDFGLARKFVGQDAMAKTKKVVGTHGYISPEYAVHGRFSIKSDVFSFGVIVLEMVSGKKNREFRHEAHSDNLLGHAWRLYKEDKSTKTLSRSWGGGGVGNKGGNKGAGGGGQHRGSASEGNIGGCRLFIDENSMAARFPISALYNCLDFIYFLFIPFISPRFLISNYIQITGSFNNLLINRRTRYVALSVAVIGIEGIESAVDRETERQVAVYSHDRLNQVFSLVSSQNRTPIPAPSGCREERRAGEKYEAGKGVFAAGVEDGTEKSVPRLQEEEGAAGKGRTMSFGLVIVT